LNENEMELINFASDEILESMQSSYDKIVT